MHLEWTEKMTACAIVLNLLVVQEKNAEGGLKKCLFMCFQIWCKQACHWPESYYL